MKWVFYVGLAFLLLGQPYPHPPRNRKRKGNLAFNCVGYEKGHEELKFRVDQVSQEKEEEEL